MDLMDLRLTGFGSRSNPSISYTALQLSVRRLKSSHRHTSNCAKTVLVLVIKSLDKGEAYVKTLRLLTKQVMYHFLA